MIFFDFKIWATDIASSACSSCNHHEHNVRALMDNCTRGQTRRRRGRGRQDEEERRDDDDDDDDDEEEEDEDDNKEKRKSVTHFVHRKRSLCCNTDGGLIGTEFTL